MLVFRSWTAPAGTCSPDDHVLWEAKLRELRQVSPRALGWVDASPTARNGWDDQRFSALQVQRADQMSSALISDEMAAPVARLVTAHKVSGGLPGAMETVVSARAAGAPIGAVKVLTHVSPVTGSRCSIVS